MTASEFQRKWAKVSAKESAAYQSHFDDLCRVLGIAPPLEADPAGETFCYQKRVIKDAELLDTDDSGGTERGFADVWRRGCFAWEYKGKKKNLDEAYQQLLRYRESLFNPPLLIVCDFDRYIIRTNFNGTVQEVHEFTNAQLGDPKNLKLLRDAFTQPEFLKPQRTTAEVTEKLAAQIARVAKSLQKRESPELADAKTRAEMNFSQRRNLRIARFLNRVVFCFFAQNTGLLPKKLFSELAATGMEDPPHFAKTLEELFAVMATGGSFGKDKIRHFNGHLFEEATVFELTEAELRELADASEADWQSIEPSIMGTLFERALEPEQRSQLGAHYTGEVDIKTLVEPVLMAPLRREWAALKSTLAAVCAKGEQRRQLALFQKKLAAVTVLDPACGSGNFLYVSLRLLLDLEKEIIALGTEFGAKLVPLVSVQQLRAIEINPYAFELAQVSVQIGYLQWRRDNGFQNDRTPVLQNLDGFQNEDALLVPHFRNKAKTLRAAQTGEHVGSDALKFYTERKWPECDVIVGNPPFLGDKRMRGELDDHYVNELRRIYSDRIPGQSDLCCYWFEKARRQVEDALCRRAGLIATQGIRGGANREVLKRITTSGSIFFAISSQPWLLQSAAVTISMVGFDDGSEGAKILDNKPVQQIHANLTAAADTTTAKRLAANLKVGFIGTTKKAPLDVPEVKALELLFAPSPNGLPNSEVIQPYLNALDLARRPQNVWILDFPVSMTVEVAAGFAAPFAHLKEHVWPLRKNHREAIQSKYWWRLARPCPELKAAVGPLPRFLITPTASKHRLFVWTNAPANADHQLVAFARDDDFFFGVLQSRFHEVWGLRQGTVLGGVTPRYTPTTCFETFPFPFADDLACTEDDPAHIAAKFRAAHYHTDQGNSLRESSPPTTPNEHRAAIAAAAQALDELRERWLNPPEWTEARVLTFPGREDGPWARYVDAQTVNAKTRIGTVRYPRVEPRDAVCAAKLKARTLTNLYNERPTWLAYAHDQLDSAVAAAYGWPAGMSEDEMLARLLSLNLARADEEVKAAKGRKAKTSREKREDEML